MHGLQPVQIVNIKIEDEWKSLTNCVIEVWPEQVWSSNFVEKQDLEHWFEITSVATQGSSDKERVDKTNSLGNLQPFKKFRNTVGIRKTNIGITESFG